MTPIPSRKFSHRESRKIPSWVPLLIVALLFLLIWGVTRYGVRGYAVYIIRERPGTWDEDGVLIQETKYSCVPCCIVMLLKDRDIDAIPAEVAWIAGTDLKGTDPEGIKRAGLHFGFNVRETQMGFDELLDENLPAIVEYTWEGSLHAVYVLPDPSNRRLIVKNPVMGLTYVYRNGVTQYFGSDWWDVFLFE